MQANNSKKQIQVNTVESTQVQIGYASWVSDLGKRIREMQLHAATVVNTELMCLYWFPVH